MEFNRHDGEDLEITVWEKKERSVPERARENTAFSQGPATHFPGSLEGWPDLTECEPDEPTLRLDLEAIEVRTITAVHFDTRMTDVY